MGVFPCHQDFIKKCMAFQKSHDVISERVAKIAFRFSSFVDFLMIIGGDRECVMWPSG